MIIYVYSKCSTCQQAIRFLKQKKLSFTCKEILEQAPSLQELQKMFHYQNENLKKLFNTSGKLYRELQIAEKMPSLTEEDALVLLSKHGMLVKRPFFLGEGFGLVGFKEEEWNYYL
ncbi:arsenate reductase family protein [Candidatus Protochlamydia sp. W-9]|uniref:arsenate reductase family protein n=1 Tax=Candidatus Protochlamydia sp. W-9 TaxID=1785087 RepID=UPI00096A373F|nr:arsenate reductase family protein [Candidatus Protochlamydia sp. W-9]